MHGERRRETARDGGSLEAAHREADDPPHVHALGRELAVVFEWRGLGGAGAELEEARDVLLVLAHAQRLRQRRTVQLGQRRRALRHRHRRQRRRRHRRRADRAAQQQRGRAAGVVVDGRWRWRERPAGVDGVQLWSYPPASVEPSKPPYARVQKASSCRR